MSPKAKRGLPNKVFCQKVYRYTEYKLWVSGFNFGIEIENSAFLLVLINFLSVSRLCWAMNIGLSTPHNESESEIRHLNK